MPKKSLNIFVFAFVIAAVAVFISWTIKPAKARVLVFSKTAGYHHSSIPAGQKAFVKLGSENNFSVDTTSDAAVFTQKDLKKYAAVVFLNTTGDCLNDDQQKAFEGYIKKGGGFMGVHAATDTEYGWEWYGKLVGAYFLSHPKQQDAILRVVDEKHNATKHLPKEWKRWDEWYNFKNMNNDVRVLLKIDEGSYTGGKNGDNHPMAWYHNYDGGRAFYTALGHTDESYADPLYLQHILAGLKYAMGK